jgi:hypothetical protein
LAIDLFHSLFGSANIDLRRSCRMQGLPSEDPKGYLPLLPNSPKGSLEGAINNEVASEVGSSHSLEGFKIVSNSLEAFRLPPNLLLSIRQDAHFSLNELIERNCCY